MHHSSPSAITYPTPPSPTTYLTASRPTPALLHPALLPTSQPYDQDTTYATQPYHPSHYPTPAPTLLHLALLTALLPAHDLPHYSAIYPRSAYPTYVHTASYPLLRSHLLHVLSCTPHTRATLHTALPISPTDVPCPPISYSLYHTALPIAPLSSI